MLRDGVADAAGVALALVDDDVLDEGDGDALVVTLALGDADATSVGAGDEGERSLSSGN